MKSKTPMLIVGLGIAVLLATGLFAGLLYVIDCKSVSSAVCNCLGSFDYCSKVIAECRARQLYCAPLAWWSWLLEPIHRGMFAVSL